MSLEIKKKSNLISKRPRGRLTSNQKNNCRTFLKLSFEPKKIWEKNDLAYSWDHFGKNILFLPSGGAGELKLQLSDQKLYQAVVTDC